MKRESSRRKEKEEEIQIIKEIPKVKSKKNIMMTMIMRKKQIIIKK